MVVSCWIVNCNSAFINVSNFASETLVFSAAFVLVPFAFNNVLISSSILISADTNCYVSGIWIEPRAMKQTGSLIDLLFVLPTTYITVNSTHKESLKLLDLVRERNLISCLFKENSPSETKFTIIDCLPLYSLLSPLNRKGAIT